MPDRWCAVIGYDTLSEYDFYIKCGKNKFAEEVRQYRKSKTLEGRIGLLGFIPGSILTARAIFIGNARLQVFSGALTIISLTLFIDGESSKNNNIASHYDAKDLFEKKYNAEAHMRIFVDFPDSVRKDSMIIERINNYRSVDERGNSITIRWEE